MDDWTNWTIVCDQVLAGYGLTETSPVIASRQAESNVLASVGRIMPDTEIRIVDQESRRPVEPGNIVTRVY